MALGGGEWSASCPGLFTPGERDPRTHWLGGPQSWYGCGGKDKIPAPAGN